MKQGRANPDGPSGQKREPIPKAVSPGGADQLGQKVGTRRAVETLYQGHGYRAPMAGSSTHKAGSQGKHR